MKRKEEKRQVRKQTEKPNREIEAEEPWLEDCPYCRGAHTAGTVERCPLKPKKYIRCDRT